VFGGDDLGVRYGCALVVDASGRRLARAAELAGLYAAAPTRAIALTKRLFDTAAHSTLEEQLELEARLQNAATATEDFREGVAAFLEKRAPRFAGR
jgi:2-(1,2-epoxy-1,2-dihydrophenyl)acetyl-CoA isomerase